MIVASMTLVNRDVRREKNAFRRVRQAGQFVEELGLIGFDGQEVIGLFFFHDMVGGGGLSMERIGADQGAPQVEIPEQVLEGGDFIGFGRDLDLAAKELGAGAFAIDSQGGDVQVLEVGA